MADVITSIPYRSVLANYDVRSKLNALWNNIEFRPLIWLWLSTKIPTNEKQSMFVELTNAYSVYVHATLIILKRKVCQRYICVHVVKRYCQQMLSESEVKEFVNEFYKHPDYNTRFDKCWINKKSNLGFYKTACQRTWESDIIEHHNGKCRRSSKCIADRYLGLAYVYNKGSTRLLSTITTRYTCQESLMIAS